MLLPRVSELPGFHGAEAAAATRREELERYQCLEAFHMAPPHNLAQACTRLVCSISALLHGGALREWGALGWGPGMCPGQQVRVELCLAQWVGMGPCPHRVGRAACASGSG